MKKLLILLTFIGSISAFAQTPTGKEQKFQNGIILAPVGQQEILTPQYFTTTSADGLQGKIPANLIERTSNKVTTITGASDVNYPSEKAVKTAIDASIPNLEAVLTKGNSTTKNIILGNANHSLWLLPVGYQVNSPLFGTTTGLNYSGLYGYITDPNRINISLTNRTATGVVNYFFDPLLPTGSYQILTSADTPTLSQNIKQVLNKGNVAEDIGINFTSTGETTKHGVIAYNSIGFSTSTESSSLKAEYLTFNSASSPNGTVSYWGDKIQATNSLGHYQRTIDFTSLLPATDVAINFRIPWDKPAGNYRFAMTSDILPPPGLPEVLAVNNSAENGAIGLFDSTQQATFNKQGIYGSNVDRNFLVGPGNIFSAYTNNGVTQRIGLIDGELKYFTDTVEKILRPHENVSTAKLWKLPNSNGTLVVSVNGTPADANGNVNVSGGGGGIPEAPVDGVTYGRKDASWVPVTSGPAPITNVFHGPIVFKATGNTGTGLESNDIVYGVVDKYLMTGTYQTGFTNSIGSYDVIYSQELAITPDVNPINPQVFSQPIIFKTVPNVAETIEAGDIVFGVIENYLVQGIYVSGSPGNLSSYTIITQRHL